MGTLDEDEDEDFQERDLQRDYDLSVGLRLYLGLSLKDAIIATEYIQEYYEIVKWHLKRHQKIVFRQIWANHYKPL